MFGVSPAGGPRLSYGQSSNRLGLAAFERQVALPASYIEQFLLRVVGDSRLACCW
jgi:hypothetical protein